MLTYESLQQDFEDLINHAVVDRLKISRADKNTVTVDNFLIKKHKEGYQVFDTKKRPVAVLFLKSSALSYAKSLSKGMFSISMEILRHDQEFAKKYIDALIFKHCIKNTSDSFKRELSYIRYDISSTKCKAHKERLNNIFRTLFY
jgi:hypothetical protein